MRKGTGYKKSATSGSHAHHGERTGAGPVAGAGQVNAGGPGRAAMRVKPRQAGGNFQGGQYDVPKGMDVYKEGS